MHRETLLPFMANGANRPIHLGASAKWYEFPEKFDLLVDSGFCLEHTPDMHRLEELSVHVGPYLARGVPVRFHAFFPGFELGDIDADRSQHSYSLHRRLIEMLAEYGEQTITVHIGLDPQIELNPQKAVDNLGSLVEMAARVGMTLSLENLRRGMTSNSHLVYDWATQADSAITLDLGHALCSEFAGNGGPDIFQVIDLFEDRLVEVHFYERESDRHYPPTDMSVLGPIVDALRKTRCQWWTIELESCSEIKKTCSLLKNYLCNQ